MGDLTVLRAEEEWQRAGAYSVRVQGMNRQHRISLRDEFDGHDGDGTRYIVILDDGYPVATCRFYETAPDTVTLGRVVVLPEYRGKNLGARVVTEAERWIRECGYKRIMIDSRVIAVDFYKKLGFAAVSGDIVKSGSLYRPEAWDIPLHMPAGASTVWMPLPFLSLCTQHFTIHVGSFTLSEEDGNTPRRPHRCSAP